MRSIEIINKEGIRQIKFDGRKLRASWTKEAEEDILKFHGLDLSDVIGEALIQEIDFELDCNKEEPLTTEEKEKFIELFENVC